MDAVKIVRGGALDATLEESGRVTVFDFSGSGGRETWIGLVVLQPHADTGPHHHGRHEVAVYVMKGRAEFQWGDRLEFTAEVGSGDFAYFRPYVPHREINLSAEESLELVVVRSDNERIAIKLDIDEGDRPQGTAGIVRS